MKVTWDIETFSECDLKKAGLYRYAEDPSTDLMSLCWAFDAHPVNAWIPSGDAEFVKALRATGRIDGFIFVGPTVPFELRQWVEQGAELHAWNSEFERAVLNGTAGRRYDFPHIKIEQTRCSMHRARVAGLPGGLEDAASVLGTRTQKDRAGQVAMRYLCKPRKDGTRPVLAEERERFLLLLPYNADDVRAERDVDAPLPELSEHELQVYFLDQRINDRGVMIDREAVANLQVLVHAYKAELEKKCLELTGIKPSRPGPLAAWVRAHGYPQLEDLQADTVRQVLLKPDLPPEVATVLKIYGTYGMKAVSKFDSMERAVCADGRLKGMFLIYGAGTGRWSATIVQLQNIFRGVLADPETAIEAAKSWDLKWIRALFPGVDPMKVFASCVRGCLVGAPGKELLFPDFSGVEARKNAWLFDEAWKLDVYRAQDAGTGPDSYVVAFARMFRRLPKDVTKKERQLGKVLELSMGYEGGVGAFVKMAATYQIDLVELAEQVVLADDVFQESVQAYEFAVKQGRTYDLPEKIWVACEGLKRLWRRAHPGITAGWKDLIGRAMDAVANPGVIYRIANGKILFKVQDQWLIMRLPSGRKLYYFRPEIHTPRSTPEDPAPRPVLYYYGVNTVTRQWGRTSTYGGKLCENAVQASCRDLLARAMLRLEGGGYRIIGHVHDEPIMEETRHHQRSTEIEQMMCQNSEWDQGLPLAVELHAGARYKK